MPMGEKTKELWADPIYREKMKKAHIGKIHKGSFKKGHKQYNTGKTQFKKGTTVSVGRHLSPEHNAKLQAGKNNMEYPPNWKGGITPENVKIRTSLEYKLWREAVFKRDNFTCQKTGTRGGDLVAHHIFNFSMYTDLRFAIDNGITLSKKAHKKFHSKYGVKNNTREQLEEFLLTKRTKI